MKHFLGVSD